LDETDYPLAKCIDGTSAGFYTRPPSTENSTTWVIFLQGGGICPTRPDCADRALDPLGSSSFWADTLEVPPTILRGDVETNPFRTAHHVYVPYCSGDAFAGNTTDDAGDTVLEFRGHETVRAVVRTLLREWGMDEATHVLLTGESAGGLGTFQNADFVATQIKAAASNPDVVVKAAPLGGYYFPKGVAGFVPWGDGREEDFGVLAAADLSQFFGSVPDTTCAAANFDQVAVCFTTGWLQQYIETPLLIAENLFDPDKIERELGLPRGGNLTADALFQGYVRSACRVPRRGKKNCGRMAPLPGCSTLSLVPLMRRWVYSWGTCGQVVH
jgi:ribosome maturation protein SDO1